MVEKFLSRLSFLWQLVKNYKNSIHIFLSRKKSIQQIELRNGISFVGNKNSQLLEITNEIFFNQVYTSKVKIDPGDVVVDIGANIGIFSVYAAFQGASRVYAYEPFLENIRLIKKNQKLNGFYNIIPIQAAVSSKNGRSKLYLGSVDSGNLLFNHNTEGKLSRCIEVSTVTLEDIFKTQYLARIDFLKIDCEGSEGAIIKSTPQAVWKKVTKIALEFHDNVSNIHHQGIEKKFQKLGYITETITHPNSPFGYIYANRK